MMDITVHIDRNDHSAPEDALFHLWVAAALTGAQPWHARETPELSIQLVDAEEMIRLNDQYRGKASETNVLSFPVEPELQERTGLLGDLIICSAVVNREAEEQKKLREHHWAHMTIHGTLHLMGYDHEVEHDAEIMEALEIERLKHLHIPNPYFTEDTYRQ